MARCHDCRRLIVEIAKAGNAPDTEVDPPAVVALANTVPQVATPIRTPAWKNRSKVTSPGKRSAVKKPTTIELRRGLQVGRYTLLYPLGEGGMGSVYAAFDPKLDRRVALKFLRTDLLGTGQQAHRQRLVREARALARLSHPNVVSIYDVAETDGSVFLAMELIDGTNARVWRELGNRSQAQILKIYRESLKALLAAHEQGIIHRDFKPDNVMVGADGIARVTDFGLARAAMLDVDVLLADADAKGVNWETLTQTGLVLGTPRYMAPEQFRGLANELTDQFSFCLSMYEALYGHYPLGTRTPRELDANKPISEQILKPLGRSRISESLRKIILKGMSPDPNQRWQNTAEMEYELAHALDANGPGLRWGAMLGIGLTAAAAAYFFAPSPPPAVRVTEDNYDYAGEIRALKAQVERNTAVDAELARAHVKIRDLQSELEDRERELSIRDLAEEEVALRRATRLDTPSPLAIHSVERSVTTRLADVLACYENQVSGDDKQEIRVRVGIEADGIVQWVVPPYTGNRAASQCLKAALKRLKFAPSETDTTATLFLSFFRLDSGLLAVKMRAKTRNAVLGQVTVDASGKVIVDCDPNNPLCGL
jgi:tRNA A-37 threonylcarbamoyl transferase component Bud32